VWQDGTFVVSRNQGVEMKRTRFFRGGIAALVCSSMLTAQLAQAASPAVSSSTRSIESPQHAIRDIALADAGVFRGQVVDAQGQPRAQLPILVARRGEPVAKAQTDQNGRFAVEGLTGGMYEVHTPVSTDIYRVWTNGTAPPSAMTEAMITPDENLVRGQARGGQALSWLANPWVLAGIVAAAIAIPLALDDDDAS
jgi:hypothetical protein